MRNKLLKIGITITTQSLSILFGVSLLIDGYIIIGVPLIILNFVGYIISFNELLDC